MKGRAKRGKSERHKQEEKEWKSEAEQQLKTEALFEGMEKSYIRANLKMLWSANLLQRMIVEHLRQINNGSRVQ